MGALILGPMLRYVGQTEATVWVETDQPCEVEVLGERERTFCVSGHHYALICLTNLEPGSSRQYDVKLDGELVWPVDDGFPPSVLRTPSAGNRMQIVFGSCRVAAPHRPPWTLTKDKDPEHGREIDALYALALRMKEKPIGEWPDILLMIGDQIYADEDAPETRKFIRERRGTDGEPGEEVADFEEYARLYRETWSDQAIRWLFSVVPSAMLFDDHDVHDDWNTSISWLEEMRSKPWWDGRVTAALASYWVYQHLGNLSPGEIEERGILAHVKSEPDTGHALHEWARDVDWGSDGRRWSYSRDLGDIRIVMLDSREGRVLGERPRRMFDEEEWEWLKRVVTGDVRHLLIADTLPIFLPQAIHNLESWNDAVAAGAWTRAFKGVGERIRRALDLEHWGAFPHSFARITELIRAVGAGERGEPPTSIVSLGGDIHHAYLARVDFPPEEQVVSPVWQAVCSPFRNALSKRERRIARAGDSRLARWLTRSLARSAGVDLPRVEWRLEQEPTFDNQFATLEIDDDRVDLRIEKTVPGDWRRPRIETSLERRLA